MKQEMERSNAKSAESAKEEEPLTIHTDGVYTDNPYDEGVEVDIDDIMKEIEEQVPESERVTTEHGIGFKTDL